MDNKQWKKLLHENTLVTEAKSTGVKITGVQLSKKKGWYLAKVTFSLDDSFQPQAGKLISDDLLDYFSDEFQLDTRDPSIKTGKNYVQFGLDSEDFYDAKVSDVKNGIIKQAQSWVDEEDFSLYKI